MALPSGDLASGTPPRAVTADEWRLLAVLGLPTFGFALATTVLTTYLPVLAATYLDSATAIGLLVAIEGVAALALAVPAGALSDARRTRRPFVVVGTPVLVAALVVVGLATTLWLAVVMVIIFYAAYYAAYEPYRAMYPDLLEESVAGRGQSTQALWRGLGTLLAIGAGGVLFDAATWLPFATGAVITALSVLIFLGLLDRYARDARRAPGEGSPALRAQLRHLRVIVHESPDIRAFLVANGLWELSLGALKTFVILYLTEGLEIDISLAAAMVAGVAVFVALAAPVSGRLADRFGTRRVLQVSLTVYGAGLLIPFLVDVPWVVAVVAPVIGFGGGVVMTLPYALLIPLMPPGDHGLSTGLYSVSRGIGTSLGPLLAGVSISALDGVFPGTGGYQAMWGVCAVAILASLPFLARVRH